MKFITAKILEIAKLQLSDCIRAEFPTCKNIFMAFHSSARSLLFLYLQVKEEEWRKIIGNKGMKREIVSRYTVYRKISKQRKR